jgi:glutaminyl-peptide cyclotransferase
MGQRRLVAVLALVLFLVPVATAGCAGAEAEPGDERPLLAERSFDGERAYQYALDQCEIGPRPTGSEAGWATGEYILGTLGELGWRTETQQFEYQGVRLRNVIGGLGQGPVVILGAHYDTRPVADRDPRHVDEAIVGGNDGASGVAVLLELADVLGHYELQNEVWLVFFDGEDSGGVNGWPFSVGSAYTAENLTVDPAWVVVVDMVGSKDQAFYYEGYSDPALRERLWAIAGQLGYGEFVRNVGRSIVDDHLPFVEAGIPAVDIIGLPYAYWHTLGDTCDQVSAESLERVGRVLEQAILRKGQGEG